jgi:hypothetical protein
MVVVVATDENGTAEPSLTKSHKLLKTPVPNELFYDFIKKIAHKIPNTDYYLIDVFAYKKATYCDEAPADGDGNDGNGNANANANGNGNGNANSSKSLLHKFCEELMPHYCKDKQTFLTRKMSYNNLNTIIRQICRHNSIECRSERKYDKSKTNIVYYIRDAS